MKILPDYVPAVIVADYKEACLVADGGVRQDTHRHATTPVRQVRLR